MHVSCSIGPVGLAVIAVACSGRRDEPRAQAAAPVRDEGRPPPAFDLIARFECNRCHAATGLAAAPPDKDCVGCHQAIERGERRAPAGTLARWQRNIHSLGAAPSLAGVGRRLTRSWVTGHLLEPTDVRPALAATMPRLAITPNEAARLAAHLVPTEAPAVAFDPRRVERGRARFDALGCASCHRLTGTGVALASRSSYLAREVEARPTGEAVQLAPDLRHTRDRFQAGALVSWLEAPDSIAPGTLMPSFGLTRDAALDLAAFIMLAPLSSQPPSPPVARLPSLERTVAFAEVERVVFRRVCWHCHASAEYAHGDGGPGNTGGFGFPARGVDLSSYTGVQSGAFDAAGLRVSLFRREPDGVPRIVAVLLARHAEVAGSPVPGLRGMPLGLPPIPLGDIQLLDTWITQGRRD